MRTKRDGLTLDANVIAPLMNTLVHIIPPSSGMADNSWLSDTEHVHVGTAPLLGIIAVPDLYDVPLAISAARLWQRLHLAATAMRLAAHPLNQPVERVDRQKQRGEQASTAEALASIIGTRRVCPTFIFRMGYSHGNVPHSPRRELGSILVR